MLSSFSIPGFGGKRRFDELTEREILALAISSEEEDGQIYAAYAARLRDQYPASAKVFEDMAMVESMHRNALIDIYKHRFGDVILPVRREHVAGYYTRSPVWLVENLGIDRIREEAEDMERSAHKFYVAAAARTTDADTRKLLGDLAIAEAGHESAFGRSVERHLDGEAKGEEDAAAHRQVAAQARMRCTQRYHLAVTDMLDTVGTERDSVHRRVGVGPGDGDRDVAAAHPYRESAERHLDRRALARIGDQAVGQGVGAQIGRTGAADAQVRHAGPAEVLNEGQGARPQHFESGAHDRLLTNRPELHPRTGGEQRGLVSMDVEQHGVGMPDQLPAAGTLPRIDAAELASQRDGPSGHLGAWLGAASHLQSIVTVD